MTYVTRIVAAAIEQNHNERGIIWPEPIAPFFSGHGCVGKDVKGCEPSGYNECGLDWS